tara:strand:- start:685 stop:1071 length:387 start_codon:yes stop_codon:yes gene_type:complete
MVNVDLVPMIDVVFQLVVFFMLSSTLVTRTGLNLDLPDAGSAQEAVTSSVVLSVVSEDEIYVGSDRYTLAELSDRLATEREAFEDRSIAIEADRDLSYGTMVAVLDILRRNGFRGANLVAQEPRSDEP